MANTELVRARPAALPWMPVMTVLSLAVFLGMAGAWVHSLSTAVSADVRIGGSSPFLVSLRGRVRLGVGVGLPANVRIQHGWRTYPVNAFSAWPPDRGWRFLGFDAYRRPVPPFPTWVTYGVTVPYWFICMLSMVLPARSLGIALRRHLRKRRGECPMCGHDLRGARKCDVCGFVAASGISRSATDYSAPDWPTQVEEVLCPLCDYDLRGLSEPRCPECGYKFTWPDVLDPAQRTHPYSFEQRDRNLLASFARTFVVSLWPPALWRNLHPAQPISVKRLLIFWLLISLPLLGLATFVGVRGIIAYNAQISSQRAWHMTITNNSQYAEYLRTIKAQSGTMQAHLDKYYPYFPSWRALGELRPTRQLIAWTLLPLASFLALLIYRISMRRSRLKPAHVLRCAIYSSGWMPALGLLAWSTQPWATALPSFPLLITSHNPIDALHWAMALWTLFLAIPLTVAYSRYLGMAKPFIGILLVQMLILLICSVLMLWRWI